MSQQLATREDDKLSGWLSRSDVNERIGSALGGYLDTEMFISHHLIHIQSDPDRAKCTVASQYQAIHTCAMLGLLAGYQQAALIPRNMNGGWQLTVMPQWQGYKALFERVPEVLEVRAAIVHKNDVFEVAGDAPDLIVSKHQYDPLDPTRSVEKLEDIRGSYVMFTFRDGRAPRYHFATAAYISKCRACAQTQNIWTKWFEQMALKTAFRSAYTRRVVNVDPMVAGRLEAFTRHEDALLGNDPRILDTTAVQSTPHQSRSAAIAGQIAQRRTQPTAQVEQQYGMEPGTLQQPPSEQKQEPVAGEITDDEPQGEEPAGGEQQPSLMAEFLEMLAKTKTRREVELLSTHYLNSEEVTPNLSSEERDEIRAGIESRLKQFPAAVSQPSTINAKPKKDRQKPLMP